MYDDPNGAAYPQCAGSICNGKVVVATRWNQYPDATHLQTVTQTWHYDSATGLANQSDYTVGLTGDAFASEHGFEGLVSKLGSEKTVTKAVVDQLAKTGAKAAEDGTFVTRVTVAKTAVEVKGSVVDSVVRVGTFYVPK